MLEDDQISVSAAEDTEMAPVDQSSQTEESAASYHVLLILKNSLDENIARSPETIPKLNAAAEVLKSSGQKHSSELGKRINELVCCCKLYQCKDTVPRILSPLCAKQGKRIGRS